jgi:hypothetical protein
MTAVHEAFLHESAPLLFGVGKAVFSADRAYRAYRYRLSRVWGSGGTQAVWVMLNPSTAGAAEDDPTIRRCLAFTKAWGMDGLTVVNLFALIATDPRELARHPDPAGPACDQFIAEAITPGSLVVAAWGAHPLAERRTDEVMATVAARAGLAGASCLGVTKAGFPRHPLYIRGDAELRRFEPELQGTVA